MSDNDSLAADEVPSLALGSIWQHCNRASRHKDGSDKPCWTCGRCSSAFKGTNTTKALNHVNKRRDDSTKASSACHCNLTTTSYLTWCHWFHMLCCSHAKAKLVKIMLVDTRSCCNNFFTRRDRFPGPGFQQNSSNQ